MELKDYIKWYGCTPNDESFNELASEDQEFIINKYETEQAISWNNLDSITRKRIEESEKIEQESFIRGY